MTATNKREFLTDEFTPLLKKLSSDSAPNFGLMTPQHMVEHLIGAINSAVVKYEGERENPATKPQLGMQQFIKSGSVITHKPSDKTAADLPALNHASLEEAIALVPKAVEDFYAFQDNNPDYKPYASYLGEVAHEDVELFQFMHIKYHLWQFGLLAKYP